jgi:hypothetical protein
MPSAMVDVATGWSERVAVMGRGQRAMEAGFERLLNRLPFAVVELHPDNASRVFQLSPGALLEGESRGGAALARTAKTIIASSNRKMTPWYASTLATCALIGPSRSR